MQIFKCLNVYLGSKTRVTALTSVKENPSIVCGVCNRTLTFLIVLVQCCVCEAIAKCAGGKQNPVNPQPRQSAETGLYFIWEVTDHPRLRADSKTN